MSSKICKLFLEFFCHHKFLGFVDQYVLKMFMIFIFAKFKVSVEYWITFIEHDAGIKSCPLYRACTHQQVGIVAYELPLIYAT